MAKRDDTAPSDLRDLLVMLRDALGHPPVGALLAAMAIRTIRLLGEQDLGQAHGHARADPGVPCRDLVRY